MRLVEVIIPLRALLPPAPPGVLPPRAVLAPAVFTKVSRTCPETAANMRNSHRLFRHSWISGRTRHPIPLILGTCRDLPRDWFHRIVQSTWKPRPGGRRCVWIPQEGIRARIDVATAGEAREYCKPKLDTAVARSDLESQEHQDSGLARARKGVFAGVGGSRLAAYPQGTRALPRRFWRRGCPTPFHEGKPAAGYNETAPRKRACSSPIACNCSVVAGASGEQTGSRAYALWSGSLPPLESPQGSAMVCPAGFQS